MRSAVELLTNVAVVVACVFAIGVTGPQLKDRWFGSGSRPRAVPVEDVKNLRVILPRVALRGNEKAGLALIEFSDFQCPYCGRYTSETAAAVIKEFVQPGKLLYGFRNFPLAQAHPFARRAGQAALCAGEQRLFWEMHDLLFAHQLALDVPDLQHYGEQIGLDADRFNSCLNEADSLAMNEDLKEAQKAGINSTPTFVLGDVRPDGTVEVRQRINGAQPLDTFKKAINESLKQMKKTKRS